MYIVPLRPKETGFELPMITPIIYIFFLRVGGVICHIMTSLEIVKLVYSFPNSSPYQFELL